MIEKEKLTQIVKEVQRDIGQFELLYSQIINRVYFWCYTVIGNETDAKDATQDAMIRIYQNIHLLKNPEMFSSWMYRLVRNNCLNYIRLHKKKEVEFPNNDNYKEEFYINIKDERQDNMPHVAYDLNETKQLITGFIDKLPIRQKEVITLYYLEEMKIDEIVDVLGYKIGSVKSSLHAGRKKLELQIQEYQDKNNVKLYSLALLPLLGLLMKEYEDEICSKQDLSFDENTYKQIKASKFSRFMNLISNNLLLVTGVILVVIVSVILLFILQPQESTIVGDKGTDSIVIDDIEMFNKANSNPYIETITYRTFPTRSNLDVVIKLKEDVDESDIEISLDDDNLHFEKINDEVIIQVNANGKYEIVINNKKISFEINNIDQYAPELVEVYNYGSYIKINIEDENEQINYDLSYVEYNSKQYKINDLKVQGTFEGEIAVSIYTKDNCYRKYFIEV